MTVSLTNGMRNALSSLTDLQSGIQKTNNRLATGKRVNSALDNAVNFFTAENFKSRANGLRNIQDQISLSLNVLKQTDKAMNSIRSTIEQAEGALRSALNSSGTNARMTSSFQFRNAQGNADASVNFFAAATDTSTNRLQSGDSFTINLATYDSAGAVVSTLGTVTVTNGASTVQQVIDAINSAGSGLLNASGQSQRVFAYLNDSGNLVIENGVNGRDPDATSNTFGLRFSTTNVNGPTQNTLDAFNFSGATGGAAVSSVTGTTGQVVSMVGGSSAQVTRSGAAATFREVMAQIGNIARDANYNGTNLLNGDRLRVQFNEEDTSSIATQGQRINASTLGFQLDSFSAQTGDAVRNFQSDREINNAMAKLKTAKETVSALQSQFGANSSLIQNRAEYTRETINNLSEGADAITLADINEEGANLTSLQTRQQLSVTALSLANQADQAILRLF